MAPRMGPSRLSAIVSSLVVALPLLLGCATAPPPKPAAPSPFVATPAPGLGDPEIIIDNQAELALTLEVRGGKGGTITVPPRGKLAMRVSPGAHAFVATAPGVKPAEGEQTFLGDMRYVWVFTVVSSDPDEGKGWFCYGTNTPLLGCGRTQAACEERFKKPLLPGEARTPCKPTPLPWTFVDTEKAAEWFSADEASCNKARDGYLTESLPKPNPLSVLVCRTHP